MSTGPIRVIPTGLSKLLLSDVPSKSTTKSAVLEIQSTDGGLLHARMTAADMNGIAGPVIGMEIYNTDADQLFVYTAIGWSPLAVGGGSGNVTGPGSSVVGDIAVFNNAGGTLLADSGKKITDFVTSTGSFTANRFACFTDGTGEVIKDSGILTGTVAVGLANPQFIQFTTADGVIRVNSGESPVYFAENSGKCSSVFTGGTPTAPSSASALVELNSTTGAFLNARMTTTERDALVAPANGMQIYNTTTNLLNSYQGGAWVALSAGGGSGDVNGPGSSLINHVATFNNLSGTLIQDSGATLITTNTFEILEDATHLFIGSATGDLTSGITNLGIGRDALNNATGNSASENVAIGFSALSAVTTASGNVAVGNTAMAALTAGTNNVAVGIGALEMGATFNSCTAIGSGALQANVTGSNTAVGQAALGSNTTGGFNAGIGTGALQSNTTGAECTAVGADALASNTTAGFNTGIGSGALEANTTGAECTAVGAGALAANTTADNNTAVGANALVANTTGVNNTSVGVHSLEHNVTGARCTAVGANSLNLSTLDENTAVGAFAMHSATGGDCVGIGYNALAVDTGNGNTAVGAGAGQSFIHNNCTMIGAGAETSFTNLTNVTLLGANTTASFSNNLILGSAACVGICEALPISTSALSIGNDGVINGFQPRIYMHSTSVETLTHASTIVASGFYQIQNGTAKPRFIGTTDGVTLADSTGTIVTANNIAGPATTAGTATILNLNGESAPIATTCVHSGSIILVTQSAFGPTVAPVSIGTIIDGTSFTIKAATAVTGDTTYNWLIINP